MPDRPHRSVPAGRPPARRSDTTPARRSAGEGARWLGLGPINGALLVAALAAIVGGYVLLDRGSVTAAPILLILGYAVFLPAGLAVGLRRLPGGEE